MFRLPVVHLRRSVGSAGLRGKVYSAGANPRPPREGEGLPLQYRPSTVTAASLSRMVVLLVGGFFAARIPCGDSTLCFPPEVQWWHMGGVSCSGWL